MKCSDVCAFLEAFELHLYLNVHNTNQTSLSLSFSLPIYFLSFTLSHISLYLSISIFQTHTHSTVILAPLVGGVAGSTILPLLLATLQAYCSTGYVRDELYHPFVKACVGSCCSSIVSTYIRVHTIISRTSTLALSDLIHYVCIFEVIWCESRVCLMYWAIPTQGQWNGVFPCRNCHKLCLAPITLVLLVFYIVCTSYS